MERHRLSYDELRREYAASLRREVQLRQQNQNLNEIILRMKGKLLADIQQIDLAIEQEARVRQAQATAQSMERTALEQRPVVTLDEIGR